MFFTSALASEGKSFCGANFATSLAQAGFRTLLVDADLRRPMVGAFFELPGTNPGLGQIFNGTSAETCIRTTPTDGLLVLQAGHGIDNPSEAFSGPKMKNLLQELKSQFDWIVIDSAPVNAVSDTLLISNLADAVCLVIMAAKTLAELGRSLPGIPSEVRRKGLRGDSQPDAGIFGVELQLLLFLELLILFPDRPDFSSNSGKWEGTTSKRIRFMIRENREIRFESSRFRFPTGAAAVPRLRTTFSTPTRSR